MLHKYGVVDGDDDVSLIRFQEDRTFPECYEREDTPFSRPVHNMLRSEINVAGLLSWANPEGEKREDIAERFVAVEP